MQQLEVTQTVDCLEELGGGGGGGVTCPKHRDPIPIIVRLVKPSAAYSVEGIAYTAPFSAQNCTLVRIC